MDFGGIPSITDFIAKRAGVIYPLLGTLTFWAGLLKHNGVDPIGVGEAVAAFLGFSPVWGETASIWLVQRSSVWLWLGWALLGLTSLRVLSNTSVADILGSRTPWTTALGAGLVLLGGGSPLILLTVTVALSVINVAIRRHTDPAGALLALPASVLMGTLSLPLSVLAWPVGAARPASPSRVPISQNALDPPLRITVEKAESKAAPVVRPTQLPRPPVQRSANPQPLRPVQQQRRRPE